MDASRLWRKNAEKVSFEPWMKQWMCDGGWERLVTLSSQIGYIMPPLPQSFQICRPLSLSVCLLYQVSLPLPLPYSKLPSRKDVLPPSAEASNGPSAHPQINHKVTRSPGVAVLTWVHMNNITIPSPSKKWAQTRFHSC